MRLLHETRGKPWRWKSLPASNADADESDSRTVKRALRRLRLFEPPAEAITGVPDSAMFRAIETFQRGQGQRRQGQRRQGQRRLWVCSRSCRWRLCSR